MKVWVWKTGGYYKVSPTEPAQYSGFDHRRSFYSPDAIGVCLKIGKVLFGPMRVRDKVKQFNLTAKEVK